jgi:hypothetical protein
MARESFLLRTDPQVMAALRRWARDDLRSVNSQVEFLLRRALLDAGRLSREPPPEPPPQDQRQD